MVRLLCAPIWFDFWLFLFRGCLRLRLGLLEVGNVTGGDGAYPVVHMVDGVHKLKVFSLCLLKVLFGSPQLFL